MFVSTKFLVLFLLAIAIVYGVVYIVLLQPSTAGTIISKCNNHQAYKFDTCLAWVNQYPYSGGAHNCCGENWNENIRFKKDNIVTGGTVVELGGNTGNDAIDGLLRIYKPKKYHIVEPIPEFVETIKQRFSNYPQVELHTHLFGVGT